LASDDVVTVVLAATITLVDGGVGLVVVVVEGTWVLTGDVEEGGGDETARTRGADVPLSVKTRIKSRSGLDHIKRWALFSEKGERGIVFEG
jgi:hypothetical protein